MEDETTTLSLLGPFAIRRNNRRQKLPFAGQTRRVFVFLAGHANFGLRRDVLLEELWPDCDPAKAGSALNTAVWRIKQGLKGFDGFAIETLDDIIRLSVAPPATVDTHLLATTTREAAQFSQSPKLPDTLYQRLSAITGNIRGPFLEGCSDHWVLPLREEYNAVHIRALTFLMRHQAAQGNYDQSLDHGRAILALDPFREGTQREMMWLYAFNGQRAQAIRQFLQLKVLLGTELGIDPMPETQDVYTRISNARDSIESLARSGTEMTRSSSNLVPTICLDDWRELVTD